MLEQQALESHEGAVRWFMAAAHRCGPSFQFQKTFAGALDVDFFLTRSFQAVLAEAGNGSLCAAAVTSRERIVERPLSLASPHESVDVIRSQVIFDQAQPEIPHVRISRAGSCGRLSVHVNLDCFVKARHVAPKYILEPAD